MHLLCGTVGELEKSLQWLLAIHIVKMEGRSEEQNCSYGAKWPVGQCIISRRMTDGQIIHLQYCKYLVQIQMQEPLAFIQEKAPNLSALVKGTRCTCRATV